MEVGKKAPNVTFIDAEMKLHTVQEFWRKGTREIQQTIDTRES